MKQDRDTLAAILSEARGLRAQRECDWPDYEFYKKRIRALLGYGDESDNAIRELCEALEL